MGLLDKLLAKFRPAKTEADPAQGQLVDAYTRLDHERERMAGKLADNAYGIQRRPVYISTRWQPSHRDLILAECESGSMLRLAYFLDAMKSDGTVAGLMDTRTGGMLRRPTIFAGDPFLCDQLRGREPVYDDAGLPTDPGIPGVFKKMVPLAELAAIVWDGIQAGIGIGEMVPCPCGGLPTLRHLDLHWLRYDYGRERWLYMAPGGTYVVTPGDGRWVVFTIKSAQRPWMHGTWFPLAWPFISKAGTALDRLRWQGQLADPLKVITSSKESTEPQRRALMRFITDLWHRSPGKVLRYDEKAELVESNGRGFEVYNDSDDRADRDIQFTLSGQIVTGNGTSGFSGGDIFDAIKNDIIQGTADAAGECITRDIIAPWARRFWGCYTPPTASLDVRSPAQRKAEAEAISAVVSAVKAADEIAAPRGQRVNLPAYLAEQKIALVLEPIDGSPAPAQRPTGPAQLGAPDECTPERGAILAAQMTEHGVQRCEHQRTNRCPDCGVQRTRELIPATEPGGEHGWRIGWQAIAAASPGTVPA